MCNPKRVLIVDDDEEIAFGVGRRLKAAGYATCTASNGEEGLEMVERYHPHVVLLDVRMPKMDGVTMLSKLRADRPTENLPVIMLSASLADQKRVLDAGARFFVRKPYGQAELLAAVEEAVEDE